VKGINRFKLLSIILVLAYVLSACSGAAPQSVSQSQSGSGKTQAMEVAFTGMVEAVSADSITVSGQTVSIDAKTLIDANIKVGDIVKVEAQVSETGAVLALKVESSVADDTNTNSSNANDNGANTNTNDNSNASNANDNVNSNDNTNTTGTTQQEIVGVVTAIASDSVTVDGVTYQLTSFTELKDAIFAGDTVKLHVIVNADGSFTVREIEKSDGTVIGDDNSNNDNSNSNVNEDNGNDANSNDDNSNSNSNNNDDHEDDDNGSNSNGNGNG